MAGAGGPTDGDAEVRSTVELFQARRAIGLAVAASLVALGLLLSPEAAARTLAAGCAQAPGGLPTTSVLFVVDQSGSMGVGSPSTGIAPSDREGNRRNAPGIALAGLANRRLFAAGHPVHVMGVIGFGDQAQVDLPLTAIGPDPNSPGAWVAEERLLIDRIKADNRGSTNFLGAFEAAAREFREQVQTCGERTGQKAIVLVTDGGPCLPAQGCNPNAPFWNGDREHMRQVKELVRASFPPNEYRIWVLTLSRPNAVDLERTRPDWEELAGQYRGRLIALANNHQDIVEKVNSVLRELGVFEDRQWVCGPNYVDPYLGHLQISLIKPTAATRVQIELQDGRQLDVRDTSLVVRHVELGPNESLVVRAPPPGTWTFRNCQDVTILAQPFQIVARLVNPTGVVTLGDPNASLEFSLTDANGQPIAEDRSFPLQWELRFERQERPDAPKGPVPDARCALGLVRPGIFACRPLPNERAGLYSVGATARAKRANPYDPSMFVVAEDRDATYRVEVDPVQVTRVAEQTRVAAGAQATATHAAEGTRVAAATATEVARVGAAAATESARVTATQAAQTTGVAQATATFLTQANATQLAEATRVAQVTQIAQATATRIAEVTQLVEATRAAGETRLAEQTRTSEETQVAVATATETARVLAAEEERWRLGLLLAALAAVAAAAAAGWYAYQGGGPRGDLLFTDESGIPLGKLQLVGRPREVRLGPEQCKRRLPAVGLASLVATAAPPAEGMTRIDLKTVYLVDGHAMAARFENGQDECVDRDCLQCRVTYTAHRIGSRGRTRPVARGVVSE